MTKHTMSIYRAFTKLDSFIDTFYTLSGAYPTNHLSIARRDDRMEKREGVLEKVLVANIYGTDSQGILGI